MKYLEDIYKGLSTQCGLVTAYGHMVTYTQQNNKSNTFIFSILHNLRVPGDLVRLYYVTNRGCYWPDVNSVTLAKSMSISVILSKTGFETGVTIVNEIART